MRDATRCRCRCGDVAIAGSCGPRLLLQQTTKTACGAYVCAQPTALGRHLPHNDRHRATTPRKRKGVSAFSSAVLPFHHSQTCRTAIGVSRLSPCRLSLVALARRPDKEINCIRPCRHVAAANIMKRKLHITRTCAKKNLTCAANEQSFKLCLFHMLCFLSRCIPTDDYTTNSDKMNGELCNEL